MLELIVVLLVMFPVLAYFTYVRYLWHQDLRKAIADLDHEADIHDVLPSMSGGAYSRRRAHRWEVKFMDGKSAEVYVPTRWKWFRTIPLDRGVAEIRRLRERNAELEFILEDLSDDPLKDELKQLQTEKRK